jgi:hypothetical protein
MLPLLAFAAALIASPPPACRLNLAPGETVTERRSLKTRDGYLEAVSASNPDPDTYSSRALVMGPDCQIAFEQRFDGATQTRFNEGLLGKQPFLFVTAYSPGGSGCGYQHLILAFDGERRAMDGVEPLAPMSLWHNNMDGVFVGDLGHGQGPGLVTWSADWNGDAHYAAHRYRVVSYRWRDGRFIGPKIWWTKHKHLPDPQAVAHSLGFAFGDMTQQERFGEC